MPTATIDNKGTYLYYEDSGVPINVPDYTTIVLIHGLSINGGNVLLVEVIILLIYLRR